MVRYRVVPRKVIPSDYIEDLKHRIENLRRAVLQRNEEIAKLREKLIEMSKDRAELLRQRADLEREKENVSKEKAEFEDVKRERDSLAGKNAELSAQIEESNKRMNGLEACIREYESTIANNRSQMESFEKKIGEKDAEMSALNEKISQYLESIAQLNLFIGEKEQALVEKEGIIQEKERRIGEYESKTSEVSRYLLEIMDVRIDENRALMASKILLGLGVAIAALGAVLAVFANQFVLSLGMDNILRVKTAVTLLGLALPICMVSITQRLFAARLSVHYLNITGMLTTVLTVVLFDLYYPESFVHPFAGTVYLLYVLAVVQHLSAVLFSLPKLHRAQKEEQVVEKPVEAEPERKGAETVEEPVVKISDESLFEPIKED